MISCISIADTCTAHPLHCGISAVIHSDKPILEPINGKWRVVDDWHVTAWRKEIGYEFVVKAGFVTDLGSVPTALEWIIENDRYVEAFVLHDWLYHQKRESRYLADALMYEMIAQHSKIDAWLAWSAVRSFGLLAWRAC